jgi:hypothetical protein
VPLPFSRFVFAFEEALLVPPDASPAAMEELRLELTARLLRARGAARAAVSGRRGTDRPPVRSMTLDPRR